MDNAKIINKLCKEYNCKAEEHFGDVKITSPSRDVWLIKTLPNKEIQLHHKNKRQGEGFHHQKCRPRKIQDCFKYIKGHEKKGYNQCEKVFRIANLLKLIKSQYQNHEVMA